MSSCLILQDKNRVFIGADSVLTIVNGKSFSRIDITKEKIFNIHNSLIFCSGNMLLVEKMIDFIKNLSEINVVEISNFLKTLNLKKNKNIFNIELIVCVKNKETIDVFQISEYNNFDIIEHKEVYENVRILAGGIKAEKCLDIATQELQNGKNVENIFRNTYNQLSCEQIGGILKVWEFSDNIKVFYENTIDDYRDIHSVVADVIVGRLLAGNDLLITNEDSTFEVDGSGATLTDASFTLTSTNLKTKILLDPTNGIKIQRKDGASWTDQFYVDSLGNVIFKGSLSAATGTFSGALSAATGTFAGSLSAATGTFSGDISAASGTFSGNIYAANLNGQVVNSQISDVAAGKITAGTIYGSTIGWGGASMGTSSWGVPYIYGSNSIGISAGGSYNLTVHPTGVTLYGNIRTNGLYGKSIGYSVQTPYGTRVLTFTNGLLTNYT